MKKYKSITVILLGFLLLCVSQFAPVQAQDNTDAVKVFLPLVTGGQAANLNTEQPPTPSPDPLDPALAALLADNANQAAIPVILWLHTPNAQADLFSTAAGVVVEAAADEEMTPAEPNAEAVERQQAEEAALAALDAQRAAAVALVAAPVLERLHSLGAVATADTYAPMIYAGLFPQQIKDVATWAEVAQVTLDQISQPEAESALPTDTDTVSAAAVVARAKAWVWADLSTTAGCYTPSVIYQYNSSGATNRVCRIGAVGGGQYRVELPGLGTTGGAVQVVAYGGAHHCKVANWGASGTIQQINVRCFSPNGLPQDGRFTLLFYKENRGSTVWTAAYLWADQPRAVSYTPSSSYQWNSKGSINTIRRISLGRYQVRLPGLNLRGGTVLVTAYGAGAERCKVSRWFLRGSDTFVNVHCFNGTVAVDTQYTLAYMKDVALGTDFSEYQHYGGYVLADQPTATACYTPNTTYQYSNTNATNTACRLSTGSYRVRLARLAASNRTTAQVTAHGTGSEYCTVNSWGSDGSGGTYVYVRCYNAAGSAVNTRFTLLYLTDDPILF